MNQLFSTDDLAKKMVAEAEKIVREKYPDIKKIAVIA